MGKTNAYKSKKKKNEWEKNCKDKDYRYQCIPDSTIMQFKLYNNIIWEIRKQMFNLDIIQKEEPENKQRNKAIVFNYRRL